MTDLPTARPLRDGVIRLLQAIRTEEWVFSRALGADEREAAGTDAVPSIKELVAKASAGRRTATDMLHKVANGQEVDGCEEPAAAVAGTWAEVHRDAHVAMTALWEAMDLVTEDQLASDGEPQCSHPQYLWRNVVILAVRGPFHAYSDWHRHHDRVTNSIAVLARWYEAVRGRDLPTKALSDASYDMACGLARVGRLDDAMEYLPDAFTYNDRAAVPVLKAWAREDSDLAGLRERPDFRTLVGV